MSWRFNNLADHPGAIGQLARWHHAEWGYLYPEETLEDFAAELRASTTGRPVPVTWVLVDDEGVWGSASILEQDMTTHPELGPWLANVYLHPSRRGAGLGRALISRAMQHCRDNGITELFLYTTDRVSLYRQLGWEPLSRELYHGAMVDIMITRFDTIPG